MFAKSTIAIQLVLISLLAILAQARPTFVPNPAMNPEPFTFDAPAKAENVQVKAQADTPAQARNLGWHGRAAYNPFHPDNLRAAALKGQQDQVRREVSGHAGLKKRGIRKISRKRACAAKTTAATTTGVASSTAVTSTAASTSKAQSEGGQATVGVPVQSSASSAAASASTSASASLPIQNGAVIPTSTLVRPSSSQAASTQKPTTSSSAPVSSTQKTSTAAPVPTTSTTSSAAPATTSAASSGFKSVDPEGNGPFNGETTYYVLGTDGNAIGACGTNLVDSDLVSVRTPS
jgi:hypothetical protein